jgi:hypothetical protein
MKTGGEGSEEIAPRILNFGIKWGWGASFVSATLRQKKEPQYLLNRRLGGTQNQSGHDGKEKYVCSCRESNPQPIA